LTFGMWSSSDHHADAARQPSLTAVLSVQESIGVIRFIVWVCVRNRRTSAITGTGLPAVGVRKQPECQRAGVRWIALFGFYLYPRFIAISHANAIGIRLRKIAKMRESRRGSKRKRHTPVATKLRPNSKADGPVIDSVFCCFKGCPQLGQVIASLLNECEHEGHIIKGIVLYIC